MRKPWWLGAIVPVLAVAACGGSEPADDGAPRGLERIFGSPESNQREERLIQDEVKSCKEALGFEYTPITPQTAGNDLSVDPEAFAKEFGFGVTTLIGRNDAFGAVSFEDPNRAYLETLSPAGQAAYQKALYGDLPEPDAEGGVAVFIGGGAASKDSCLTKASLKVRGENGAAFDERLLQQLDALNRAVQSDPRVVEAYRAWSKCMAAEGFKFADEDAVRADLARRAKEITGLDLGGSGGIGFVVGAPTGGSTPPAYDEAALKALQAEELRIAAAARPCTRKHVQSVLDKVGLDAEERFVDANPGLERRPGAR
ncbi:MAG: hypothetical protein ACKVVT_17580 [Dehalococcoidia bacterium]